MTDVAVGGGGSVEVGILATLEAGAIITPTGLRLTEELTLEQWAGIGRTIGRASSQLRFAVGDWTLYGAAVYGEEYAQYVNDIGLSPETIIRYANVCRNVLPARRREDLTFSHHAEVAALEPGEQKSWLARAAREGWSSKELRREVRALRLGERTELVEPEPRGRRTDPALVAAAVAVWQAAHRDGDEWRVPAEPMARLRAALGEVEA